MTTQHLYSSNAILPSPSARPSAILPLVVSIVLYAAGGADAVAAVNPTVAPDVTYVVGSTRKIEQLIGNTDFQRLTPTLNRTQSRYGITGSDLGVPFTHNGLTYVVFGDTQGAVFGDRDPMAMTTDRDPEDGLLLDFLSDGPGTWRPITIPGISQAAFEVPVDGVSVSNRMYLYHTTDHSASVTMGRSVVAVSTNDGRNFELLYTFSTTHFINVSVNKVNVRDWPGFPQTEGEGLAIFGSGSYRASDVRLAFQPVSDIDDVSSLQYFAGLDAAGQPLWSGNELDAIALFDQPCVGELSVGWNKFIRRWVMLYNCESPRGINFRTARQPWGPWTQPQVLFEPWNDLGYAYFMHANWTFRNLDAVHNPGRQDEWGGEYGPYLFKELATGTDNRTTIYFTMSTWNPYVSVLMKSELQVNNAPVIVVAPTDQRVADGESARFQLAASAIGALAYRWQHSNTNIPGATSNVFALDAANLADDGAEFRCIVSNASGAVTSNPVRLWIVAGNSVPAPEILTPAEDRFYHGGETISFSGAAVDPEDGVLPASAFRWQVLFMHGGHAVPFLGTLSGVTSNSFTVPVRGEQATNVFFRVLLTVTDFGGRSATVSRDVFPRTSVLTLTGQPSGLPVRLDGQARTTPATIPSVAGMKRVVAAATPASSGGQAFDFKEWSDGGDVTHTFSVPETNATLAVTFRPPTILVATNARWRYLVTPSAPAATWKSIVFPDEAWPSGPAQLGFGDGDEATAIGSGPDPNNRYTTTYFRHAFNVVDPSVFGALLVRLLRDDGGIVSLNGTEIFRSNMGGGAVAYATQAVADALPADETTQFYSTNLPTNLLRFGTNVVAVEIHQRSANSSDLSFALELRGVEDDPHLTVAVLGGETLLTWPFPSAGYALQSTTNLSAGVWSPVATPVVFTNGQNRVNHPTTNPSTYFRLRRP
jgi:hypothetical protein